MPKLTGGFDLWVSPKVVIYPYLGYSLTQSAYLCLDLSSSKIIISSHINFVVLVFPFCFLQSSLPYPQSTIVSTWVLPIPLRTRSTMTIPPPSVPPKLSSLPL